MDYIQTLGLELVKAPAGASNSRFFCSFTRAIEIRIAERGHLDVIQLLQSPQMVLADIAGPYQPHAEFLSHFLLMGAGQFQMAREGGNRILAPPDGFDRLIQFPAGYIEERPTPELAFGLDCAEEHIERTAEECR